jgi:heme/copper-type cytochrome/quinol oxidase subunit 2
MIIADLDMALVIQSRFDFDVVGHYNRSDAIDTKEENKMGVPGWVWVVSAITIIIVSWIAIYTVNKAYSKKWEEPEEIPKDDKKLS